MVAIVSLVVRITVDRTDARVLNTLGATFARQGDALLVGPTLGLWRAGLAYTPNIAITTLTRLARIHLPGVVVLIDLSAGQGAGRSHLSHLLTLRTTVVRQLVLVLFGTLQNGARVAPTHRRSIVTRAL